MLQWVRLRNYTNSHHVGFRIEDLRFEIWPNARSSGGRRAAGQVLPRPSAALREERRGTNGNAELLIEDWRLRIEERRRAGMFPSP